MLLKTGRFVVIIIFCFIIFCAGCTGEQDSEQKLIPATVTRVVDGDTLHVIMPGGKKEKLRLIGIDTPESTREIEPYGKKASSYTKNRLDGEKIWLEKDVEERDRYNRFLVYIWLSEPEKKIKEEVREKMFNAELLLKGYAQLMTVPPNVKYVDYFKEYQREARKADRGLWELKEENTEDYYVGSKNSDKFHRPGCKWAQKIDEDNLLRFESRDEAYDAGYQPCEWCDP